MAQLFAEEAPLAENRTRRNFVFMGYPFAPPLPRDDYAKVVAELQQELPIRFWYFLDEITTAELMRKIWRAILRAELCVFDVSGGNSNVAFELGLAVAANKRCLTLLKKGEPNPLGTADLGYAERLEYTSAATLKDSLRNFMLKQSSPARLLRDLSNSMSAEMALGQPDLLARLTTLLRAVFNSKRIKRPTAREIMGNNDALAGSALVALRANGVLTTEGATRGARWVFTSDWVYHDHEVMG